MGHWPAVPGRVRQLVRASLLALILLLGSFAVQAQAVDPYVFQSSPYDASPSGGLAISTASAAGYTFRVTQRTNISEVGAELGTYRTSTTVYAALYRVGTPNATPDVLNDSQLLATALLSVPNGQGHDIHVPMTATLAPGWYAIVLGSGKFGATAGNFDVTLEGTSGSAPATSFGPYSAYYADNSRILQGTKLRIYLRGTSAVPVTPDPNAYVMRTAKAYAAASGSIPRINAGNWYTARFEVNQTVHVNQATGWFWKDGNGSVFAAILQLASPSASMPEPGSNAFTNAVVATTLIALDDRSEAYSGSFSNLMLTPGSYAIVVGSGAYGATGSVHAQGLVDTDMLIYSRHWNGNQWVSFDHNLQWVLTGSVVGIQASPDAIDFGTVGVGMDASRQVTVSNLGSSDLHIGALSLSGGDAAQFALAADASNCSGKTLVTQASCSFTVTYAPAATGSHAAELDIASDSSPNPLSLALSGDAVSAWIVTASASGGGSINPVGAQTVAEGGQPVFTLTPGLNHHVDSVGGSCGGNLVGTTYTTAAVHADCTVVASFAPDMHAVGGTVTGLLGSGLQLSLNSGAQTVGIGANGTFTFATLVASGSSYAVSVASQPGDPTQHCMVVNGSGTVGNVDVSNVVINCGAAVIYRVGGTVSGLTGGGLRLQLNGGAGLAVSTDGPFTFLPQLPDGAAYVVAIQTQPQGQVCSVANASGSISGADVNDVAVSCEVRQAKLQLSITDHSVYARYGQWRDYFVTLSNTGNALGTLYLSGSFSAAFDRPDVHWTCLTEVQGVTCGGPDHGGFSDFARLPAGSSITWMVTAPVLAGSTESTATFSLGSATPQLAAGRAAAMPQPVADTDTLVIFRDGVDVPYANGTQATIPRGELAAAFNAHGVLRLTAAALTADGVHTLQRWSTSNGRVAVQQLHFDGRDWVRLRRHSAGDTAMASAWAPVQPGTPLVLGSVAGLRHGQRIMLLEGGSVSLRLPQATARPQHMTH